MLIDRNEMIAPRDVSASYGTYKKNSELEDVLTASPGSNSLSKANDYAATATFQHPFRWKIANIPQGSLLIDVETGVKKKTFGQDLGVMKNFKEMIESFNSPDNGKKTFAKESKLLEKLKEAMKKLNLSANEKKIFTEDSKLLKEIKETVERINSSDDEKKVITEDSELLEKLEEAIEELNLSANEKKIFTEDSELLKAIKEIIERINSSEWALTGIRKLIEEFPTTTQFDLQGIRYVEENIKDQNLNLEIGKFPLVSTIEKARKALYALSGEVNTGPDAAGDFLEFLEEQKGSEEQSEMQASDEGSVGNTNNTPPQFDLSAGLLGFLEEQSAMQAMDEGSTGNTNNTSDSGDSADYNLLNIEA